MRKATMINGMVLVNNSFMVGRDGKTLKLYKRNCKGHKVGEWSEPTIITNKSGYRLVCVDGSRLELLHRLVWIAFNGKIPDGLEINHIDEDKSNNSLENLELVTREQNMNHGTCTERSARARSKPVIGVNIETGEEIEFASAKEAQRNGFHQSNICACLKGRQKTAYGYKWYYKN